MEHIVNPWFIYLLGLVDNILGVSIFLTIVFGLISIIYVCIRGVAVYSDLEYAHEDVIKIDKSWGIKGKLAIGLFLFFIFISVFCPSKNDLIAIYIADKLTYDTAEEALRNGKAIKDELKKDVIEIIESITKQKEEQ